MARSFTLKVTTPDIVGGARENSVKCMIAQAVKDIGGTYPVVTMETIAFNFEGKRYSFPLPATAAKELVNFDKGKPILPFPVHLSGSSGMERETPLRTDRPPVKTNRKTPLLKGARRVSGKRRPRVHRGIRRVNGVRVIEG